MLRRSSLRSILNLDLLKFNLSLNFGVTYLNLDQFQIMCGFGEVVVSAVITNGDPKSIKKATSCHILIACNEHLCLILSSAGSSEDGDKE